MAVVMDVGPRLLLVADEKSPGERLKARREALELDINALADRVPMDRGQLSKIERGKSTPRPTTITAIERAMDAYEEEISGPYDADSKPAPGTVTFRIRGNFGVEATVQGPVADIDRLEQSAERMLRRAMEGSDTPTDSS